MKKAKLLLALTALLCVVLMFGACGKELKATEVYSGKYDNTTEVYTKSEEKFSGATNVLRGLDDYFLVTTEKEVDYKDVETNDEGDGYILVDDKITAKVYTVYDASYKEIKSFEESYTLSLSSDAKTVTGQAVRYNFDFTNFLDVDVIRVNKTVTVASEKFGSDFESEEEYTTAYFYMDGTTFIDFTEIKSVDAEKFYYFFGINGTYYYEKDGKLEEAFKEEVFGNKMILAMQMNYRLGDTFYKETECGVKVYNAALEQIACYEFDETTENNMTGCIVLPNGNVIVQYKTRITEDGTKYDYIDENIYFDYSENKYVDGDDKFYKLTTVLLNVEKNKAKEISFDYVIDDFETVGIYVDGEKTEKLDGINEEINCVVYGYPVQEYIDFSKGSKLIVVEDDGTIKGVVDDLIENQDGYATVIGKDLYMVKDVFGNVYTVSGVEDSTKTDITLIRMAFENDRVEKGDRNYSRVYDYSSYYDNKYSNYVKCVEDEHTSVYTQYGVYVGRYNGNVGFTIIGDDSLLVHSYKYKDYYNNEYEYNHYYIICGTSSTQISLSSDYTIKSCSVDSDYGVKVQYTYKYEGVSRTGYAIYSKNGTNLYNFVETEDYSVYCSLSNGVVTVTYHYTDAERKDETRFYVFVK